MPIPAPSDSPGGLEFQSPALDSVSDVEIRALRTHEERVECVDLQKVIWGDRFTGIVPTSILLITAKIGGLAAAAFGKEGPMLGFVLGFTGPMNGKTVHWSHMLGVRPDVRRLGLGRRLKEFQRQFVLANGIRSIYWTYDPLVSGNAHLNLNRLGVDVVEYVDEMYGRDTQSELHQGLGTDRFVVHWNLEVAGIAGGGHSPAGGESRDAQVVNDSTSPVLLYAPDDPIVRVEIPGDIHELAGRDGSEAERWRVSTREAFRYYLRRGYRVLDFHRDDVSGRAFYGLGRGEER